MHTKVIEYINQSYCDFFTPKVKDSIESTVTLYCPDLLHDFISDKLNSMYLNHFEIVAIIQNNLTPSEDNSFNFDGLYSIKTKHGRIFLEFTTLTFKVKSSKNLSTTDLIDILTEDLNDIGFKGVLVCSTNCDNRIFIGVEYEFNNVNEFESIIRDALKEITDDYIHTVRIPEIFAVQIYTKKQIFIMTPFNGCYSKDTIILFLKKSLLY